jgi:hypothetical protein
LIIINEKYDCNIYLGEKNLLNKKRQEMRGEKPHKKRER